MLFSQHSSNVRPVLIKLSFFFTYETLFLTTPFFSISTIEGDEQWRYFIAALIWVAPNVARASTIYLFNRIAEEKGKENQLVFLGYTMTFLQFLFLYTFNSYLLTPWRLMLYSYFFNLFTVAYIPSIKAYFSRLSQKNEKGRSLGNINTIMSIGFGVGILTGGFLYQSGSTQSLLLLIRISLVCSLLAIILFAFSLLLDRKLPREESTVSSHSVVRDDKTHQNEKKMYKISQGREKPSSIKIIPFSSAIRLQFFLTFFSSTFFSLFGPYLKSLGYSLSFFGIANALAALLGIFSFQLFGRLLDKYGPLFLFHYAWIVYFIVYLGLLSKNLVIIVIMWTLPGYSFYIATEFIATLTFKEREYARAIAKSQMFRTIAIILGNLTGGLLMVFYSFSIVIYFSLVGIMFCAIGVIWYSKKGKKILFEKREE